MELSRVIAVIGAAGVLVLGFDSLGRATIDGSDDGAANVAAASANTLGQESVNDLPEGRACDVLDTVARRLKWERGYTAAERNDGDTIIQKALRESVDDRHAHETRIAFAAVAGARQKELENLRLLENDQSAAARELGLAIAIDCTGAAAAY